MRYQVEDFGEDLLERICWFIGADFSARDVGKVLKNPLLNTNKIFESNQELRKLCYRYDYLPFFDKC